MGERLKYEPVYSAQEKTAVAVKEIFIFSGVERKLM